MRSIAEGLLQQGIELVILGSGEAQYENFFNELCARNPGRVGVYIGFNAKLAQRIILELRDKVSDEDISMPFSDEIGTISTVAETIHNTAKSEAISALVALGYGQTDAAAVIAPMEDSLAVDELIRRALKSFTRGK